VTRLHKLDGADTVQENELYRRRQGTSSPARLLALPQQANTVQRRETSLHGMSHRSRLWIQLTRRRDASRQQSYANGPPEGGRNGHAKRWRRPSCWKLQLGAVPTQGRRRRRARRSRLSKRQCPSQRRLRWIRSYRLCRSRVPRMVLGTSRACLGHRRRRGSCPGMAIRGWGMTASSTGME
jgi:hypothetical protein